MGGMVRCLVRCSAANVSDECHLVFPLVLNVVPLLLNLQHNEREAVSCIPNGHGQIYTPYLSITGKEKYVTVYNHITAICHLRRPYMVPLTQLRF